MSRHLHDPIDRRRFLARSALVGGAALTSPLLGRAPWAGATGTVHWGSTAQPRGGQTQKQAFQALETLVGRPFSTVHQRMPWTTSLVNGFSRWAVENGHTPILSWFARNKNKSLVGFRKIANGGYDAWITEQARNLRAAGWSGYLCFHKEPEDETTPADWIAAYGRVRQIFQNVGVTNFRWVVCLTAATYKKGAASLWVPGAAYDLMGVDGNNRYRCKNVDWRSFSDVFAPARNFALSRGRRLYVVEYGCIEGESGRKATWFDDAARTLASWPEVEGVSYLHESSDCTYWVDTSTSALNAFRAMGRDPLFIGAG